MKYYETTFDEYITSVEKCNLHPELLPIWSNIPLNIYLLNHMILYGPPGCGKYSQVLYFLKKYSPSQLKYNTKIICNTDKQQYIFQISDIHYEIDMSLLGCNSKIVWHEIFNQITDIISVKQEKIGIIICKNFHMIHTELLEIFYSYMQNNHFYTNNIKILFFILTEHISFIPNKILYSSKLLKIKRPSLEKYNVLMDFNKNEIDTNKTFQEHISKINDSPTTITNEPNGILNGITPDCIVNIKEIRSFTLIEKIDELPNDVFNIICDTIISDLSNPSGIVMTTFRDKLYDILTYNLDINECLWYILSHFIHKMNKDNTPILSANDTTDILTKSYSFLKYFNNNYRPIFHLESIMYYMINKIHKYESRIGV